MRRTSIPYAVGNNYYGPHRPRFGKNLVTWFTVTPVWLIHGGFEQNLGVNGGYEGRNREGESPVSFFMNKLKYCTLLKPHL